MNRAIPKLAKDSRKLLVLVDMDGVIADFDSYLFQKCREQGKDELIHQLEIRDSMKLVDPYYDNQVVDIIKKPGFFYNLPVIDGALQAIKEMVAEGHDIMICTTPLGARCVSEKYLWLEDNVGEEWIKHIVMTSDKTIVQGDYIIDDNHHMTGYNKNPTWTHILFDRPYNQSNTDLPRMKSWSEWRKFIVPKN